MTPSQLRTRLLRALALALAAQAASCCEVRETSREVREDQPGTPWAPDTTCAAVCLYPINCSPGSRLVSCTLSGPVGSRVAACVFEQSECPQRPIPASDCGRRYAGATVDGARGCDDPLGALFGSMAALEAESIPAFEALADALAAHGAPTRLQRAARRAADDERRHTLAMGALAAAHGATVPTVTAPARATPTLVELARDNAVEGCVRETFGALVALWQAERAADPTVRATMRDIARDELRHAALGWQIDAWADAGLTPDDRAEVARAKRAAVAELRAALGPADAAVVARAGFPSHQQALRLLDRCEAAVWQAAS